MSVNPSFLIFDSSACLGMICYRVSTEKLPPTSYSRSQDRWRQPCVFSAPRCSALEGVQAGYRRTTQGPIKNTCRNRNIMSRTIEVDFLRSPVELWQRLLGRPALAAYVMGRGHEGATALEGANVGYSLEHWAAAVSQCGISIMSRLDLPPRLHHSCVRHRAHRAAGGHARATPPSDLKGGHS